MARNNRLPRRRPAGRQRRSARRRVATRRIAHLGNNGPVRVRMPIDPPMRSTTHERHYVIRFQVNYDVDSTTDGWVYGNNNEPITYRFAKRTTGETLSVPFTVKQLFDFHSERYGFDTGVCIAVQSLKVWGPLPPMALRTLLYAYPREGCAPQSYEDVGNGVARARVGINVPILYWYSSPSGTALYDIMFQTGDQTPKFLASDAVLGVVDVSFVARNNK